MVFPPAEPPQPAGRSSVAAFRGEIERHGRALAAVAYRGASSPRNAEQRWLAGAVESGAREAEGAAARMEAWEQYCDAREAREARDARPASLADFLSLPRLLPGDHGDGGRGGPRLIMPGKK